VLGRAFRQALGDRSGIRRFGEAMVPLDEALCSVVVDISGRSYLAYNVPIAQERVGTFQTELVHDFMKALSDEVGMNLHLKSRRRPQSPSRHRGRLQGARARDGPGDSPRAALKRRAVDQGHVIVKTRLFEKFTVIPSIDLKGGQVVRLWRGEMDRATVYGSDPAAAARAFEAEGAQIIHVVDLDGANRWRAAQSGIDPRNPRRGRLRTGCQRRAEDGRFGASGDRGGRGLRFDRIGRDARSVHARGSLPRASRASVWLARCA